MAFGAHIKKLRESAGMSAQLLADKLGVKVERLRKWEANDSTPRFEDSAAIEESTGIKLEDFLKLNKLPDFSKKPAKSVAVSDSSTLSGSDMKDRIILQLVESNKKLVDNTVDLTQMAKENWATGNASPRSEAYMPIDGPTVLRLLALVASRNRFRDKKEAESFLAEELDAMISEEEAAQQQLRNAVANRGRQAAGTLTDADR